MAALPVPAADERVDHRHHRRARRGEVDAHRPPRRAPPRARARGSACSRSTPAARSPVARSSATACACSDHATDPDVFIRSMATRGHLGGLARAAPQAVRVLAAAGYAWIAGGDGRGRAGRGGDRGHRRHDGRRRQPGLGRRRAGGQGGPARDRRRVRRQQGRPRRVAATVHDLQAMLELAGARGWRPPCSRPSPPTTGASTRSSTRSAATGAPIEASGDLAAAPRTAHSGRIRALGA